MATINVKDADGATVSLQQPLAPGRAAAISSRPVALSTEDKAALDLASGGAEYETVAVSQTNQVLGATGATGDYLSHVLIIPTTTSPGAVSIKDGAGGAITIFNGGASSLVSLAPFSVRIGAKSVAGAWQITTGTNVSAIGFGDFT